MKLWLAALLSLISSVAFAQDAVPVEPQPELYNAAEQVRAHLQERTKQHGQRPLPPAHDDIDGELLEFIELMTEPAVGHEQDWL